MTSKVVLQDCGPKQFIAQLMETPQMLQLALLSHTKQTLGDSLDVYSTVIAKKGAVTNNTISVSCTRYMGINAG
jgi:hypothetical protein